MKTVFLIFFNVVFCNAFNSDKTVQTAPLPDFRRRMEEIIDETIPPENTEDPSHSIVSFLIQNVKEIFKDTYDDEDNNEESQTDSVNIKRRKELEMVTEDEVSDKVEAIADINYPDSSTENGAYYTLNKPDTSSSSLQKFKPKFDMNVIDELKNERDLIIHPLHHKYEPDFEESTVVFRPVFQIMTRHTTERAEPSTALYFQNRATKLFNPEFEFQNESVVANNDDLSTLTHIYSNKSYVHPFPFLISKTFEEVTSRQPNTAKGLMFLAGPATETLVTSTTLNDSVFEPTRTPEHSTVKNISDTRRAEHLDIELEKKEPMRSCIRCNNAAVDWCSAPTNKLIPSTLCKIEGDLCYSMHTPFGIVDRGCFNVNHNMSTHVCACNLCNYISYNDLPVMFASKQEWIQDIFDLKHFKSLRKSTMKILSCLKCEVNSTKQGNAVYNTNCKEGNLGVVQTVNCKEDEICGIKTIKNQGYIWRGCISAPLYNYYITLCDSDLCNYDPIASVYDIND